MAEIQRINVGGVDYTLNDTTARSWISTSKKAMYWGPSYVKSTANRDVLRSNGISETGPGFCSFSSGGALLTFGTDDFYYQIYSTSSSGSTVTDKLNAQQKMAVSLKKENVKNILILGSWHCRCEAQTSGNVILGINTSNGTSNWYSEPNWKAGGNNFEKVGIVAPNDATEFRLYAPGHGYMIAGSGVYQSVLNSTNINDGYNLCIVYSIGGSVASIAKSTHTGLILNMLYFGGYE